MTINTAKLFQTGRGQAVRLQKEYRFEGTEVMVKHFGSGVLLMPVNDPWSMMQTALEQFEPGFQIERNQPPVQDREELLP